jgi:hypothetical protein
MVGVGNGRWCEVIIGRRATSDISRFGPARLATAERLARAVFLALAQTVSADEFADVQAQLSRTSRGCCREILLVFPQFCGVVSLDSVLPNR